MPNYFAAAAALLPEELRAQALALPPAQRAGAEEVRLRAGRAPTLRDASGERAFAPGPVTDAQLAAVLERASGASLHACTQELRRGFLTAPGGVRVGVCGTAVWEGGAVKALRAVSSVCIRVARPVPGAGREILPQLMTGSVLILSAPGGGKTTFLRELVRVCSEGGERVAVADERGELAGATPEGLPGFDLGQSTDVMTDVPRAEAAVMLLRSMAPQAVAMDELADESDAAAVRAILGSGARILATAHAADRAEASRRAPLRALLDAGAFDTLVRITCDAHGRRHYAAEGL